MGTPLAGLVADRIRAGGPLPFAAYMQLALYNPSHGYYAGRAPGPGGDYRTSPTLTPWFGRLLGRVLERMWRALGEPGDFTVVEPGAGRADLAAAALEAAGGGFARALRWQIVEPFPAVERWQRERLGGAPVTWARALGEVEPVAGCVLANEVLDNFPVHLMEVDGGRALEVYVDLAGERLVERLGPPSSPALAAMAAEPAALLEDGDRFELRPGVEGWCREAAAALRRGWLVVIDYGDLRPDLWLRRPAGTLVTYRAGALGADPLESPGECDVTAHVDFTALAAAARSAGLEPQPPASQREVLRALGIGEVVESLREAQRAAGRQGSHAESVALMAERGRLEALAARGGLGDLLVLAAARNAPPLPWAGRGG